MKKTPRTLLVLLLGGVLLTGCAPDPVTPLLEAESAQRQAEMLQRGIAVSRLGAIASASATYAATNGSTTGFSAAMQREQPQVYAELRELTDTSVTVQYAPTKCVMQLIPTGTPAEIPC